MLNLNSLERPREVNSNFHLSWDNILVDDYTHRRVLKRADFHQVVPYMDSWIQGREQALERKKGTNEKRLQGFSHLSRPSRQISTERQQSDSKRGGLLNPRPNFSPLAVLHCASAVATTPHLFIYFSKGFGGNFLYWIGSVFVHTSFNSYK